MRARFVGDAIFSSWRKTDKNTIHGNAVFLKEAFTDLLRCFVPENLLRNVDFGNLEKQPETFIPSQYGELRDDIVWRMKTTADQSFFVYIITEFQSSVLRHMVARIDEYFGVPRRDMLRSGVIRGNDPPSFCLL